MNSKILLHASLFFLLVGCSSLNDKSSKTHLFSNRNIATSGEVSLMQMSGFSVVSKSEKLIKLKFRDDKPFVISLDKFSSEGDAVAFCKKNGMKLDTEGLQKALLIAMSGAANADEELKQAISFKLNTDASGIWAWSGENNNIIAMRDGQGTGTEIVNASQISNIPGPSAICE